MAKKTNYQVTVGYKAVICFDVKAEDQEDARQKVLDIVGSSGIYKGQMQDENYSVSGILDMDSSWNMVQS